MRNYSPHTFVSIFRSRLENKIYDTFPKLDDRNYRTIMRLNYHADIIIVKLSLESMILERRTTIRIWTNFKIAIRTRVTVTLRPFYAFLNRVSSLVFRVNAAGRPSPPIGTQRIEPIRTNFTLAARPIKTYTYLNHNN